MGPENPIRVERDDTAELFCEVDSKPRVAEVRWVRDNRFVQTSFRHLIPRANLKDAGPYICNADNGLGQVATSREPGPRHNEQLELLPARTQRPVMNFANKVPIIFARLHFRFLLIPILAAGAPAAQTAHIYFLLSQNFPNSIQHVSVSRSARRRLSWTCCTAPR